MSRSSWINIRYFKPIAPPETLTLLENYGWCFVSGAIYDALPGKEDIHTATRDEVELLFVEYQGATERIAINMRWQDSDIMCMFLFYKQETLADLACYPTKHLAGMKDWYSDVSWYLERLLPPFLEFRPNGIEEIKWEWNW